MLDCDALVVGAGPAGSAAAIRCAEAGLRVVLLERDEFPRRAPGESLHPGVQPLLRQLGVEEQVLAAGFLRYPGHVVRWDGPEFYEPFGADDEGPWLGFQAWRPVFDAILLDRARALGVRVLLPSAARGVLTAGGRVMGVATRERPFYARFTVDATGRRRALSRWLDLKWSQHGPDRRVWCGYVTGTCPDRTALPALKADREGWTWVARVREHLYQWTRYNFDNARPAEDWLPPELSGLAPAGATCGHDVTWRIAPVPAGPGYFLTGDAAAMLDPASSHGVLKAVMSGILAGHLIARVHGHSLSDERARDHYNRWVRDWFHHDVVRLGELYARLRPHPETISEGGAREGEAGPERQF